MLNLYSLEEFKFELELMSDETLTNLYWFSDCLNSLECDCLQQEIDKRHIQINYGELAESGL